MIYNHSQIWTPETIGDIHARASGGYRMSGFRPLRDLPSLDDLVFLAAGLTRFPLEGYKEKCKTETTLGADSSRPLSLEVPVYVSSSQRLPRDVRAELARGSALAHTALSVDGKLLREESRAGQKLVYELEATKAGAKAASEVRADAIQVTVREQVSVDSLHALVRSIRKSQEQDIPVFVSVPAGRLEDEVKAATKVGAAAIVVEGLETKPVSSPAGILNYCRLPLIAAIPRTREILRERGVLGKMSIVAASGIRNGADAAKALALGADAVRIDDSALVALGYYRTLDELLDAAQATRTGTAKVAKGSGIRVAKFINSMVMEIALFARSMGKGDVHSLEYEDLSALTVEASMMSGVRLSGE